MNLNDALRLDLETLAMHGNAVAIVWHGASKKYIAAACKDTDVESMQFVKHCSQSGEVVSAASIGDAVGYLHDVVMGEDE